jgi:hypothetical protein
MVKMRWVTWRATSGGRYQKCGVGGAAGGEHFGVVLGDRPDGAVVDVRRRGRPAHQTLTLGQVNVCSAH